MRLASFGLSTLPWLALACGDSGGDETAADESSSSSPATSSSSGAASEDGADSTTAPMLECDDNVEFLLADGVELGPMSVEAIRREVNGDVQYDTKILGDAAGTTELDIVFWGLPSVGTEYPATALMQLDQPNVALLPPLVGELDFQSGTVTYSIVGTAEGDTVAFDFHLEFIRGTVDGCVHTDISVEAG
ncbi:MAG TPA: hypothetical protein VFG69_06880 [Nannocystaceae bacterium]|nr:hypothetical protein [Nannocystaceae bacterium]